MARKWKDSRGFTLVETLCAVAILVMLGLLINTGLHLAMRSYRDLTAQSELELLAASLSDALADELRYAQRMKTGEGNKLARYHSERYNMENTDATTVLGPKKRMGSSTPTSTGSCPAGPTATGPTSSRRKTARGSRAFKSPIRTACSPWI